jgi:tRNA pseudouridine55 synthase
MEGKEVARAPVPAEVVRWLGDRTSSSPLIEAAVTAERERTSQVPPAYSAIRIGGERAHELARAGRLEGDLPPRPVEVRTLEITGGRVAAEGESIALDVRIEATKGYFVRSLARDLARGLGTVGHLTALRRLRSGGFTIADAVSIDDVTRDALITVTAAASRALPVTILDDAGVRAVSFGQRVAPAQMRDPHPCPSAWLDPSSRLIAIGECEPDGSGRVLRGFPIV